MTVAVGAVCSLADACANPQSCLALVQDCGAVTTHQRVSFTNTPQHEGTDEDFVRLKNITEQSNRRLGGRNH